MLNNKSELTNWAQNTKQKNTNWHQNSSQKSSKNPIFVVRKWAPQEVVLFLTLEVVPKLTLERPKRGTKTNSPVQVLFSLFFPSFIVFLGTFRNTNSATVCQNSVFAKFGGCQKWGFRKENCIFCFFFFMLENRNRKKKKKKMEKAKNPIKIGFFKVVIQKCEKAKKKGFLAKIAWHYLCQEGREKRAFSCTLSVLAKQFFWTKTV